ncbi:hypothetical protein DV737_g5551, partial [Chaetothyriales sp. CBS 132003]
MLQALRSQPQTKPQMGQAAAAATTTTTTTTATAATRGGSAASARGAARQRGKSQVQWNDANKRQFAGQLQHAGGRKERSKPTAKLEEQGKDRFEWLKEQRKRERAQGIADGLLHDPGKKRTLDTAITPVGTCEDMCAEFERVERVQRHEVDRCEKTQVDDGGPPVPAAERMVKKFVRSDAGREEQLPSDIRTPDALVRTMDYLIDDVVGKEDRLIACHNFVWDRTRAVRNDFSIQQVSAEPAVRMAVDCHERSARFLILSLHVLSDDGQLLPGDHFDAQQDVEQLNKTFTSLWHYYDAHRDAIAFPNEAEFRSYQILFEILSATPDLEDRMHFWPYDVLADARVQTALRLYQFANDTLRYRGPLRPFTPDMVAQMNACAFWDLLASPSCSYLMACVAEISFYLVRFGFLAVLWKSVKSAPKAQQERMKEWTVGQMRHYLSFDDDAQVEQFCAHLGIGFHGTSDSGERYLDFARDSALALELENVPRKQIFSNSLVEVKRLHRNYVALISGKTAAEAIEAYEVQPQAGPDEEHSMFFPEPSTTTARPAFGTPRPQEPKSAGPSPPAFGSGMFGSGLNPAAKPFETVSGQGKQSFGEAPSDHGKNAGLVFSSPFGINTSKQSDSSSAAPFNFKNPSGALVASSAPKLPTVDPSAPFDSSKPFGSTHEVAPTPAFSLQPPESRSSQPCAQKPAFDFKSASPTRSTPTPSSPVKRAMPPLSTTPPSSPPRAVAATQQDLIAYAARLALTQPNGLLHEFLEYTLENILPPMVEQHAADVFAQTLARLKTSILRRKFAPLWRRLAYESSLNRRAAERRKRFAQSLKMEAEKKRKRDDDLHEIMAAMEDSKRIRAEQERVKKATEKAKADREAANVAKLRQERSPVGETKKWSNRMAVSTDLQPPVRAAADPLRHHHKRARSSGAPMPPPPPPRPNQPGPRDFRASIFSTGNSSITQLSRSRSLRESQRARSDDTRYHQQQQQDNTHTDFFRLLAHNVDPETPLIPLTQAQIDARAKKEKEERDVRLSAMYNRRK